jgi:hypothetical protein
VIAPKFDYLQKLENHLLSHPHIPWHIGIDYSADSPILVPLSELQKVKKMRIEKLSIITSGKRLTKAQNQRLDFIDYISEKIPERVEIFGRDGRFVQDKSSVLGKFQYHLALENAFHESYWTEKLADPLFLGNTVFYSGAPDIKKFFPSELIVPINLENFDESLDTIVKTMDQGMQSVFWNETLTVQSLLTDQFSLGNLIESILSDSLIGISQETEPWLSQGPSTLNRLRNRFGLLVKDIRFETIVRQLK